jgi:hypothetical protein
MKKLVGALVVLLNRRQTFERLDAEIETDGDGEIGSLKGARFCGFAEQPPRLVLEGDIETPFANASVDDTVQVFVTKGEE